MCVVVPAVQQKMANPGDTVLPPHLEHLQAGYSACTLTEEEYQALGEYQWSYVLHHIAVMKPTYEGKKLAGTCSHCWEAVVFGDGGGNITDTEDD